MVILLAEKCIVNPERDCLGLAKAKRLEENIDEMRASASQTIVQVEKRLTDEIHTTREIVNEHTKALSRLETLYSTLEGLPSTITSLDKTITIIGNNLETMNKNLEDVKKDVRSQGETIHDIHNENKKQEEKITTIDNKSKIDWAEFITKNFWKVFGVFGLAYVAIKLLLERG